jgi:hypothetical protein
MSSQISKNELLELASALGIAPPEACTARYIFARCLERARLLTRGLHVIGAIGEVRQYDGHAWVRVDSLARREVKP